MTNTNITLPTVPVDKAAPATDKPMAAKPTPRVLADLSKPSASAAPKAAAKKAAPAKGKHAIPALEGRKSSVAGIFEPVMQRLNSVNGDTVANVAAALKIKEGQVRGVIDKARALWGYNAVERMSPGRFRYMGVPKAAKAK